jgi:formylglycine-generating enzyme required for sulfatase activity
VLLSRDAIASEYIHSVEVRRALERHEQGTARVVPVIARVCAWRDTKLGVLQAIPRMAIADYSNPDTAWEEVRNQLRAVIEGLLRGMRASPPPKSPGESGVASASSIPTPPLNDEHDAQPVPSPQASGQPESTSAMPPGESPASPKVTFYRKPLLRWLAIVVAVIVFAAGIWRIAKLYRSLKEQQSTRSERGAGTVAKQIVITNIREDQAGMMYLRIPAGKFIMGCSPGDTECEQDEHPRHEVEITRSFWMGRTTVTLGAFRKFSLSTGGKLPAPPAYAQADDHPVVNVSWDEAVGYCAWAGGRLPTEAEWEYAARGGSDQSRYGPLDSIAWFNKNVGSATHSVGKLAPNIYGLYDMLGNVWVWCNDWYDPRFYLTNPPPSKDPTGPAKTEFRATRGGCWVDFPKDVRVSCRYGYNPGNRGNGLGFRCVREEVR